MSLLTLFSRSDATRNRSAGDIATTQFGHAMICHLLVEQAAFHLPLWWAVPLGVVAWALIWEGLQYLRQLGEPRRVRRRWDWVSDGAAYVTGGAMLPLELAYGWWGHLAAVALIAVMVGILAEIWGQEQPPT